MGAWGMGVFENDSASDWVHDLVEQTQLDIVISALGNAVKYLDEEEDFLEESEASEALAAAEVVAALAGNPSAKLPEEILKWLNGAQARNKELMSLAKRAVRVVKTKSELRDLWKESDGYKAWILVLEDLQSRLR